MKPTAHLELSRYDYAFESLKALLPSLPSRRVFDVGPGDGRMKRVEGLGVDWNGFDKEPWGEVLRWDLNDPCPDRAPAGAVFLLDVIEHCVNPGLALHNIASAMLPDARMVLTTPNPRWSACRINMMFRGYASGFSPLDLEENHHVFPTWPHILEKMLNDAGLVVDDYVTLGDKSSLVRHRVSPLYPVRCLFGGVRIVIEHLDRSACGMSYAVIARKTGDHV